MYENKGLKTGQRTWEGHRCNTGGDRHCGSEQQKPNQLRDKSRTYTPNIEEILSANTCKKHKRETDVKRCI